MSTKTKDMHWLPLHHRDFQTSTAGWTAEERGHYLMLLMHQWEKGSIPLELKRLELITPGVSSCWPLLKDKFPGGVNARMAAERADSEEKRAKKIEAGAAGGRAKQENRLARERAGGDEPTPTPERPGQPGRGASAARKASGASTVAEVLAGGVTGVVANGVAEPVARDISHGVAPVLAERVADEVANSYTITPNPNPIPSAELEPKPIPVGARALPDERNGGEALGSVGVGGLGAQPADDPNRAIRDELARQTAEIVKNRLCLVSCLAAIDRMSRLELERARQDIVEARKALSPGGVLVHRWIKEPRRRRRQDVA